jgi:general secretion pathway protein D
MNKKFKAGAVASLATLLLMGCASTDSNYSMDAAKETFKSRQLPNGGKVEEGAQSANYTNLNRPRRKLVQFRYAPTSFQQPEFQTFLQRLSSESSYANEGEVVKSQEPLTGAEKVQLGHERSSKRRILISREMRILQAQLNSYGFAEVPDAWRTNSELSFRGASLPMVMNKLAQQNRVSIQVSERLRFTKSRVSGSYRGDLLSILKQLTTSNNFEVRIGMNDQSIHVLSSDEVSSPIFSSTEYFNPFAYSLTDSESTRYLNAYREIVSTLSSGEIDTFNRRMATLKPPAIQGAVVNAHERLVRAAANLNQTLKSFDQETVAIQNGIIPNSNLGDREISASILSKGIIDRAVCPGQEIITEKLFVYQESPKEVVKFLDGYFKNADSAVTAPVSAASAATSPAPAVPAPAAPSKRVRRDSLKDSELDRCSQDGGTTPFKVIEDPMGVIVTGTIPQIELAVRLTNDVDLATKQVLAEVFLVEVQKNWARTIQTKIGAGKSDVFSSGSVATVVSAAEIATSAGVAGAQGRFTANGGDITGFINLLERNSVGRNISSPTLIAKNGEEAEISKVLTLRRTVTTAIPGAGTPANPTTLPNQQVQKLDVPLKLRIKPTINQHNKHVTLKFEYEETSLSPAEDVTTYENGQKVTVPQSPIERGTVKNMISTTFETAPGDVVVLAGIFKEANSKSTSSLPGLSSTGAFAALFGGADGVSTESTELLVFVKPTVIEPKAKR